MRTACFMIILLLLAVDLATARSATTSTHREPPGLVKGIKAFLVKNSGIWTWGRKVRSNSLADESGEEDDGIAGKKCITFEHCRKKKMTCSKQCSKARGQVDKKHFPGKCFVKCKKCIPTC